MVYGDPFPDNPCASGSQSLWLPEEAIELHDLSEKYGSFLERLAYCQTLRNSPSWLWLKLPWNLESFEVEPAYS